MKINLGNIPSDPIEPPPSAVDGFVFKPAGSDVVQVWQKINGQHVRIDDATARSEGKASE
ncbi:hypothetical protein BjapCC829_22900 [Bradyrhizobium barranii]|uniref:Uncharacterized protein n=1 Tax=Bradyrhizobium barranii TaxID=2992140 RepID=A0ABY3QB22_9BRAD|nr:hypothetical protein [Bradyrhizobium japonicum]UFW82841.1 hypothetical protein BjapCC829_22900 [Bradyrhizobium japonicum]